MTRWKAYVFSWNGNGNTKRSKVIFIQTDSSIFHENSFQNWSVPFFRLSKINLTHPKRKFSVPCRKRYKSLNWKFTSALTFYNVNFVGDHVWSWLPSGILEKDTFLRVLDMYHHNSRKAWPTSNSVLQMSFFSILNPVSHETNTFRRVTWFSAYYLLLSCSNEYLYPVAVP